ncbi:MAG: metallopeptidase family protein [Alphaproteobacteria bacterium]|jgi:predicted Zn-dependent protease with MMP-like domain|nr:metallopeptidase family protein [Alphaproteobacteria bacterium]MDP7191134.1 metallopeptidase family protein [Alphaproteobacteria bacterium]MDP7456452.1 metallopeptidase family protein [Alphaproteobacteria bacterium]HJO88243.1 metallopeptidase family protein [Alphaproteobacteria bacterium]|tara:strand:+ start:2870 stop:3268 length:399 start_codon:yes stop_codon:yes gene_type:complete
MKHSRPHDLADIEALAAEIFASIPEDLRRRCGNVVFRVEECPDEETKQELNLESPYEILGLYRGVSLDDKSVSETPQDVDMIFLYRAPLLDCWCETEGGLSHLIRHVLIHEIGHHFGFSDADMERIEAEAES